MKILTAVKNLRAVTNDPFGFIVDTVIKIAVNLVIPIPLAGDIVARLKGPVLAFLSSIVILGIMLFITLITIFVSILLTPTGFFQFLTGSLVETALNIGDERFVQSAIPSQNPFGGSGMSYTSITAGFMDPGYFLKFGKTHTGIDLVPNQTYYDNSSTYEQNSKIVIFSTHTGKATYFVDGNGGETVEVLSDVGDLKTVYIHFKDVYVNTGDDIQAGTPLGEMGNTGFSTGDHLHYEIRIKEGDNWRAVNPLTYIK